MMNTLFQEKAVELTRQISNLVLSLRQERKALPERTDSIQPLLNDEQLQELRLIAEMNYNLVYAEEVGLGGNQQQFLDTCHWLIERLEMHTQSCTEMRKAA